MRDDALLLREELVKGFNTEKVGELSGPQLAQKTRPGSLHRWRSIDKWYQTALGCWRPRRQALGAGGVAPLL